MNNEPMAAMRPTLSLPFGRTDAGQRQQPRHAFPLSGQELRRIVSDLIG